jgi:hypothetical protein
MLPGTYRFDLRPSGWWLIAGNYGPVTACCSEHLNSALAKHRSHPAAELEDETAYA